MIGRHAREILPEQAPHYIAGYMIANDISARSVTFKAGRAERPWDEFFDWLNGKWSDGFLPLGPYLVTADEIENPQNLDMELKVNGQIRQKANTSQMIFSVAEIVSFISHLMTLEPGDVIATGTPHGVGMADGRFLQPGDKMECAIQGLGVLVNTLGPKPNTLYQPLCS
jgi:2-keto-4-pentenoate hydratase/2-oxohepta-3-ene-1,7-dioic acid hydratase in catechol pathway